MSDHDRLRDLLADVESHVAGFVAVPGPQAAQEAHRRRVRRRVVATGLVAFAAAVAVGLTAWATPDDTPTTRPSPSPSAAAEPSSPPTPTPTAAAVGDACTSTFDMAPVNTQQLPTVWLGVTASAAICPGAQLKVTWALYRLEGDTRRLVSSKSFFVDQATQRVSTALPGAFCGDALAMFLVGDTGPVSTFSDSAMRGGQLPYPRWSKGKSAGMWDFFYSETPCS